MSSTAKKTAADTSDKPRKLYKWSYNVEVDGDEFIKRLAPLVISPVRQMMECDGDMFMSEYQKLVNAFWQLFNNTVEEGDEE